MAVTLFMKFCHWIKVTDCCFRTELSISSNLNGLTLHQKNQVCLDWMVQLLNFPMHFLIFLVFIIFCTHLNLYLASYKESEFILCAYHYKICDAVKCCIDDQCIWCNRERGRDIFLKQDNCPEPIFHLIWKG